MLPIHLVSHRNLALRAYLDRVRAVGAVSPASALPRDRLPPLADADFSELVDRGDLREGAPGKFYLFERSYSRRNRLLLILILWAILFLLPLVVMQLLD